jgi:hypothetical protein
MLIVHHWFSGERSGLWRTLVRSALLYCDDFVSRTVGRLCAYAEVHTLPLLATACETGRCAGVGARGRE